MRLGEVVAFSGLKKNMSVAWILGSLEIFRVCRLFDNAVLLQTVSMPRSYYRYDHKEFELGNFRCVVW